MREEIMKKLGLTNSDFEPKDKVKELTAKLDALIKYQGLVGKWNGSIFEVVKEQKPTGDYTNPILYVTGMTVTYGKFYKFNDGNIWECIKDGTKSEYTSEWFDIVG